MGHLRLRSDSHEARSTGRLDPREIPDSHDPRSSRSTLPHLPTYRQESMHLMQPPTTSYPRGYSTASMEAVPVSNPTFYYPSWDGRWKPVTVRAMPDTVPPSMPPRGIRRRPSYPEISGVWPYPFPVDPPRLRLDPASTNRRSTKGQCLHVRSPQDLGSFTVPSLTPPWYSGDGRPFLEHVATATSTASVEPSPLRHRPGIYRLICLHLTL
jgi:hypothetical protein